MGTKRFDQEEKLEVLKSAKKVGIKEAAQGAEVHYTTVYDWKKQVEALGEEAFLAYDPPSPGRGEKKISEGIEEMVLSTWKRFPGFGPGQVRNQLRRQGTTVSVRTVRRLMEANGYKGRKRVKKEPGERFEASRPLELAQMDILEFFINKLKVYLMILLDDFSRFVLGFRLLSQTSVDDVIGLVREAIGRYGKMEEVLTDRGFVFYSWKGANRFEKYLELERIEHAHASAHHPKTLGKVEALNGRVRKELLNVHRFAGVEEAKRSMAEWFFQYNYERTHEGLGGLLTPADRFHGLSDRALAKVEKGIDLDKRPWYGFSTVSRSIMNVTVDEKGGVVLYLFGQPITLKAGKSDE